MEDALVESVVSNAPAVVVLMFLVYRQQALIEKLVGHCGEDEPDDPE